MTSSLKIVFGSSQFGSGVCANDDCRCILEKPGKKTAIQWVPKGSTHCKTAYLQLCVLCSDAYKEISEKGGQLEVIQRP